MKRFLAVMLAIVMVVSLLAACGESAGSGSDSSTKEVVENNASKITRSTEASSSKPDTSESDSKPIDKKDYANSFDGLSNVEYVMIYNPGIYDPDSKKNKTLSTGKLTGQIDTGASRADDLVTVPEDISISPSQLGKKDLTANVSEQNRASGLVPTYKEGDTRNFFYYINERDYEGLFTCMAAGKHCYIWVLKGENVSKADAKKFADEFDTNIHDKDVKTFGTARFDEDGGKVNMLVHPMWGGVMGFFAPWELYSMADFKAEGYTQAEVEASYINTDHAIIHIGSHLFGKKSKEKALYGTAAHEFQHLINMSSALESASLTAMQTWLDEAMSGYIEEAIYPGVKDDNEHYYSMEVSSRIRNGQSLYNFDTDGTATKFDIGVYGSVYLFSEYLSKNSGKTVLSDIHKYWRTTKSKTLTTSEGIYNAVSSSYKKNIDSLVSYPSSIKFTTKSDEWMSKMTLDFYISVMKDDASDPACYKKVDTTKLLYDSTSAAKLEGGGRIIFATKNGKFSIPSDADKNLCYVGFDKSFNQITNVIVK